ncbi:Hypothetical protein D9617_1g082540 [Elsinoe fawcettii]|nr:Hypothetical protein D9617_1g082540 [Elsinoe fawcettii]
MRTEVLYNEGDVLVIPGTSKTTKLLVSSVILRTVLPVFKALLPNKYTEGQNISASSPKEIALEDDNTEALVLLMRLLHFKTPPCPKDYGSIYYLAIICDKYMKMRLSTSSSHALTIKPALQIS